MVLLLSIPILSFISCREEKTEKAENKATTELNTKIVDYEIVNFEDQSRKAFFDKQVSEYHQPEIERLSINKKSLYRIVLPRSIKENQVRPTVQKIITDLTFSDPDVDEIILWLYSDKETSNSTFDIGSAVWAPKGKLGNVNESIARNNNRESYQIEYEIRNNLDEYLSETLVKEDKFNLTIEERKQIFKEIVKAEDNANGYEQIQQEQVLKKFGKINDSNREKVRAEYDKINNKSRKLTEEYKFVIIRKHKITAQHLKEIAREGQEKYWPLD